MPKFRNDSPFGDIDVPAAGGLLKAGVEFEVSDEVAALIAGQTEHFTPVDTKANAAVKTHAEQLAAVNVVIERNPLLLVGPDEVVALAAQVLVEQAEEEAAAAAAAERLDQTADEREAEEQLARAAARQAELEEAERLAAEAEAEKAEKALTRKAKKDNENGEPA